MTPITLSPAYTEFLDYLLTKLSPEDILAYKVSESAQIRADELTEHNKSGTLSANDEAELQQLMELELLFSVLKVRAITSKKQ